MRRCSHVVLALCVCFLCLAPNARAGTVVTSVAATDDGIVVHLRDSDDSDDSGDGLALWAVPIWAGDDLSRAELIWTQPAGEPVPSSARLSRRPDEGTDRLFHAFVIGDASQPGPWGEAQFATDLSGITAEQFPLPRPEGIKGLSCPVDVADAQAVGAVHLNHNIDLAALFADQDGLANDPNVIAHTHNGRVYLLDKKAIDYHDARIGAYTRAGARVTAILLNYLRSVPDSMPQLIHPATDVAGAPMGLGAFNLSTEEGFRAYAAAIDFLAERYSRPDARFGLLANYIVGNELPSHWTWYNLGHQPAEVVLDEYERALRVTDLIVRSHHRAARVFLSSDHAWANPGIGDESQAMTGLALLAGVNDRAKQHGDYPWGVAYHPYPSNLGDPRFWDDPTVTRSMDTPRITPLNVEVLSAYLRRPELQHAGKTRTILFSEQGFHCPAGPDGEALQAAAYVLAFWRMRQLPELEAFHLHRHVDHLHEGGLRLGLWSADESAMPANPSKPLWPRKIHAMFAAMGTEREAEAIEFAEEIIGQPFEAFAVSFDVPETTPAAGEARRR